MDSTSVYPPDHGKAAKHLLERLHDLHEQATTERSHYYVAACCRDAIVEIERLRRHLEKVSWMALGEVSTEQLRNIHYYAIHSLEK